MTQAGTQPPLTAPLDDPVRAALDDCDLRAGLDCHARARLGQLLSDRPLAVRREQAEDAVQEVCRRALEVRERFDSATGTVAAWLHGMLERVLHERCRAVRKQPLQPTAEPDAWGALAARMSAPSGSEELTRLLALLPEEPRRIVTLHHLDGLSHDEIAARLGISPSNSRVRLARAMNALRTLGEQVGEQEGDR